jgi:small-conductance mechanosensitive channel
MKPLVTLAILISALYPVAAGAQQAATGAAAGFRLIPGVTPETEANIILSVLIVLLMFFGRRGIMALVNRRVEDSTLRYRWAKVTANLGFIVALLILFQIWFTAIRSVGTFLGLLSAGVAIALKDLIADLAGWAFIVWRRPFDLGDRIQIGAHAGDVVDRRIFQFTIMEIGNWVDADQSTGRLIHVPNAMLFTVPLANYIAGFPYLWNELKVLVTFESDWRKAKELLNALAEDLTVDITREAHRPQKRGQQRFLIHYRKLTPVVYVSVGDSGVLLTLRYLCRPRERRGTAGQLWERVLDTFAEHPDVTLAYPTQRINLGREELAEARPEDPAGGEERSDV